MRTLKTHRIAVRLKAEQHKWVVKRATKLRMSLTEVIDSLISRARAEEEK